MTFNKFSLRPGYLTQSTWVLLVLASVGLFATSVYRAATFPFVHDESLSYATFTWAPMFGLTANNHLLNTQLMRWCANVFGPSELALRLPNLLAHSVYLVCGLLLLKRLEHPALRIAG